MKDRPDADAYLRRFVHVAHAAGFVVSEYGQSGGFPLLVAERATGFPGAVSALVSSGIHGDEPAGPMAILSWLSKGVFSREVSWTIFPLLNPTGWDLGTRECAAGHDLNRDYREPSRPEVAAQAAWLRHSRLRCDWALCLHEDWESSGVYVYELSAPGCASLAREMLDAAAVHIAREPACEIDGMPARRGVITPSFDDSQELESWPEALLLARDCAPRVHTMETPSAAPLALRMAALEAAFLAGLSALRRPAPEEDFVI